MGEWKEWNFNVQEGAFPSTGKYIAASANAL
jgi:hypothetical protein